MRGGLCFPKRGRWSVAVTALLLVVPGAFSLFSFEHFQLGLGDRVGWQPASIYSPLTGDVAVGVSTSRLWVAPSSGGAGRLVDRGSWIGPIGWINTGELVYRTSWIHSTVTDGIEMWLAWNPSTGRRREVLRIPMDRVSLGYEKSRYAAEPGGNRIACFRRPQTRLKTSAQDVWVVDAVTGKARLVAPWVWADTLFWRAGRIYVRSYETLQSVSPDGGPIRSEVFLAPEDVSHEARRGDPLGHAFAEPSREARR